MPQQGSPQIWDVLLIILYLLLILAAAYFVTRAVGKYAMTRGVKRRTGSGRLKPTSVHGYLSIIDRAVVDKDKSVLIVEFKGHQYLLGATPDSIRLLDKVPLSAEELEDREEEAAQAAEAQRQSGFMGFGIGGFGRKRDGRFDRELAEKLQEELRRDNDEEKDG